MSRASQYAAARMRYLGGDQTELSDEELRRQNEARSAGFASYNDMLINRQMRNQLEMSAAAVGFKDPYSLVPEGRPLTDTAALQEAWNRLPKMAAPAPTAAPVAKKRRADKPAAVKATPKAPAVDPQVAQLQKTIAGLKSDYTQSLSAYQTEAARLAKIQEARMAGLQNLITGNRAQYEADLKRQQEQAADQMRMQQQQFVAQLNRPTTAGVKTAIGGYNPMQIARLGTTGTFGRTGLRISSLNI